MHDHEPTDSDAEYVERIRRGIARYDRLRWALVAIYLALAVGVAGLFHAASEVIRGGQLQGLGPGFAIGLAMGASLGLLTLSVTHGLLIAFSKQRTARLLVRYYDAAREAGVEQRLEEEPPI